MPGRPRPLQIEAAAVAVYVQHLAAGVKPRHKAALQRLRVKFVRAQAAGGHLRLVEAAGTGDGQLELRCLPGDTLQIAVGEVGGALVGEAGGVFSKNFNMPEISLCRCMVPVKCKFCNSKF